MAIELLKSEEIEKSLKNNKRQYLLGDLKLPQDLEYIRDNSVETGITEYKSYAVEAPHYHTDCTEYQYVLKGKAKYLDLDSNEETEVCEGDFFVIRPNTKYYQKAVKGTKILFFKAPGGNDKIIVENLTEQQIQWGIKY